MRMGPLQRAHPTKRAVGTSQEFTTKNIAHKNPECAIPQEKNR